VKPHPYRSPPPGPGRPPAEPRDDLAAPVVLAVVWLSSAARFALAVVHHEPTGFQPALALTITALVPLFFGRTWRRRARRGRS